jgi:prepilin-type N-terminal cleavage/methylation domain-containing protein/prepilin-type processing-associated H-X9-DG protein
MKSRNNAFTLVELLVVIAIIGILASILFPVFGRAREMGRRASCQSNLKQIGLGLMQYSQDYDEILIADWYGSDTDVGPKASQPLSSDDVSYKWMDASFPYIKNEQVFICPSAVADPKDTQHNPATPWKYYQSLSDPSENYGSYTITHGYGANQPSKTPPVSHPLIGDLVSMSRIEDATGTVWVSDGDGAFYYETSTGQVSHILERHLEMTNCLFVDGHVKAMKLSRINQKDATGSVISAVTIQQD